MANDLSTRKKELLRQRLEGRGLRAGGLDESARPERIGVPVAAREDGDETPMPAALQRLWFIGHRDRDDISLNVGVAFALSGDLDPERLRAAFESVVGKHEPLRAAYDVDASGTPVIRHRTAADFTWAEHDLADLSGEAAGRRLRVLARREQSTPFDLRTQPPLRVALIRRADDHVLLFTVHHIAWDDESWRVLFDDLAAAYAGQSLTPPPVAVADLPESDPDRVAADLAYWRDELTPPPAPLDLPAAGRRADGRAADPLVSAPVPAGIRTATAELARSLQTTPFAVTAAATMAFLHRAFGADDLLLAVPTTTRPTGAQDLIGYFGNTLLLRGTMTGQTVFGDLAAATAQRLAAGLAAASAPIDQVVAGLDHDRTGGDGLSTLVSASLSVRGGLDGLRLDGVSATDLPELTAVHSQLPLEFALVDGPAGRVELEYDPVRLSTDVAQGLVEAYVAFLAAALAAPAAPLRTLPLLSGAARETALAAAVGAAVPTGSQTLVDLFATAAAEHSDHPAVVTDDEVITYRDLDGRANAQARHLLAQGVRPGDVVALVLPAGADFITATLAVLKAGAAYLPVDPDYPAERIAFVLADASPKLVLDQHAARPAAGDTSPLTDAERGGPVAPASLAYVIYTSGSTGTPKGVGVEHRAIAEHLRAVGVTGIVGPDDRLIQTSSVSFDASMFEIFATLTAGATLVLPRPKALTDIAYIASILVREQVTVMHMVPSLLSTLLLIPEVKQWTTLATVPVGGEALAGDVADAFTTAFTAALSNNYGPTEAVVAATHYPIDGPQGGRVVPIGRPNAGVRAYLLDAALQPVPDGVVGEIHLGGTQLARGYLGRPGLTAERFVADPFVPGARMYRTGDLARRTSGGDLEFVGRADGQVKIRGHRIELGEVEAVLAAQPGIARALARLDRAQTGDRLLAYVIADDPQLDEAAVLAHARSALPGPLVPDAVVLIDEMPLTAHGKLDESALPVPAANEPVFRAPGTPTEQRVAAVFGTLFGTDRIGADDSFFSLGGHSLLAARLVTALTAEFGLPVDVRLPFDHPTVSALAAALVELARSTHGIELDGPAAGADDWGDWADADFGGVAVAAADPVALPAPRPPLGEVVAQSPAPLAFSQLAMWFAHRFEGPTAAGNIPLAFTLTGPVDQRALAAAINGVIGRHPALRTSFTEHAGLPVQTVADRADLDLTVLEVDDLDGALSAAADTVFDLERPPLVQAQLLRAGDETRLSLVFHHLVVDHASIELIVGDLVAAYRDAVDGGPGLAPYEGPSYGAYATWQHQLFGVNADPAAASGRYGAAELGYWRERLAGIPDEIAVAIDRPRPGGLSRRAVIADTAIAPPVRTRVRGVLEAAGVSEFMAVQACFAVTLATLGGGTDLVVGTPAAGRDDPDTQNLVGLLANMVALRTDLSGDPTLTAVLHTARTAVLEAFAHQDTPIERLVEALNPRRTRARNPLFQSMIHFRDRGANDGARALTADGGVTLAMLPMVMDTSFLDLNLIASVTADGGLDLRLVGAADLYDDDTVQAVAERLAAIFAVLADAPETHLSELELPGLPATVDPADHGDDPARLAALIAERAPRRVQARPTTLAALPHSGLTQCPSVESWIVDGPGAADGLAETLRALAPQSLVIDNHHRDHQPAAAAAMPALGGEPRTPTERALVTILAELVDADGLGVDDNFFAVGGDSVISIQWCARAAAAGIALDPQQVFDCYTIAELAEAVDAATEAAAESDAPVDEPAPSVPMSASGLSAEALSALGASWEARR